MRKEILAVTRDFQDITDMTHITVYTPKGEALVSSSFGHLNTLREKTDYLRRRYNITTCLNCAHCIRERDMGSLRDTNIRPGYCMYRKEYVPRSCTCSKVYPTAYYREVGYLTTNTQRKVPIPDDYTRTRKIASTIALNEVHTCVLSAGIEDTETDNITPEGIYNA